MTFFKNYPILRAKISTLRPILPLGLQQICLHLSQTQFISMRILLTLFLLSSYSFLFGQEKKEMDPSVYATWNRITNQKITDDGQWLMYTLKAEEGDPSLHLVNLSSMESTSFNRAKKASFDQGGKHAFFMTNISQDSLDQLKRKGTKKKDFPKDSLHVVDLNTGTITSIPEVKSYAIEEKWGGYLTYHLHPSNPEPDTSSSAPSPKKESKDNGSKLIVHHLKDASEDTLYYVTDFDLAEESPSLAIISKGDDSLLLAGVYYHDLASGMTSTVHTSSSSYKHLSLSKNGNHLSFLVNQDTTKARIEPFDLCLYDAKKKENQILLNNGNEALGDFIISGDRKPYWSYQDDLLYFGARQAPILQDTNILDDEIVNVEVWHYQDQVLYTQQENRAKNEQKRSYIYQYDIASQKITGLADLEVRSVAIPQRGTPTYYVGMENQNYEKYVSWKGFDFFDLYKIDAATGKKYLLQKKIQGSYRRVSPSGKYVTWYNNVDQMWMLYDMEDHESRVLTDNSMGTFYNELHDQPSHPWAYGRVGWTNNEDKVWIYDRYDIWEVDPKVERSAKKITDTRSSQWRNRMITLDYDNPYIDTNAPVLLHQFNDQNKQHAYAWLENAKITPIFSGEYALSRRPMKAKNADVYVYTKEDMITFPDLQVTKNQFKESTQVSNANPQISDYRLGKGELITWTGLNGDEHQGMLFTPEDLDPNKKYPLIVNFYERSSDRFYNNRAPYAHRSTINYSYYLSKGYVIFNPDVHYKEGYPGQSCYNSVMPGVDKVLEKGFIDESRMGLQGHSWGGYQIADLLTRTNRFKCAESGAPVVNMISAYGGIRWGSGLSRMFQYEKTQSRLGATLWEKPELYLENSPIFNMDKVETPVLILHNDEDGAVPWYQGIEYFVAMRRLGKPAWLLNYNKEPHWPVKWQNRKDFNIRMEQFFDHYLMDKPMPLWMKNGVPAIEKGIRQGLESDQD